MLCRFLKGSLHKVDPGPAADDLLIKGGDGDGGFSGFFDNDIAVYLIILLQGDHREVPVDIGGLEAALRGGKALLIGLGAVIPELDIGQGGQGDDLLHHIGAVGQVPQRFGQLQQGNITPHVEMMRLLATQFSAATGLTVTDTGVVNDANPTSSDAILAQSQTLVRMAEELNATNGDALRNIALMALAIVNHTTIEDLDDEKKNIVAHFRNPAMPSVAVTADAAIKIASARQSFAQTDIFLEMIGFSQADIRRIKAQERMGQGLQIVSQLEE